MKTKLLTEQFRPQSLDEVILTATVRKKLGTENLQQNLILNGSAGTGKTSVARILTKNHPTLFINISDESSVDTVREKIKGWCVATSLVSENLLEMKAVVLDEFDGASPQFYLALRGVIEQYADTVRFIATSNDIHKIPDPILSRLFCIDFNPINSEEQFKLAKDQMKKVSSVTKTLGIQMEKTAIIEFVKRNSPDLRKMLNKIQGWQIEGITKIELKDIGSLDYSYREIMELLVSDINTQDTYEIIAKKYGSRVDDVLAAIGRDFASFVRENRPELYSVMPHVYIIVADSQRDRHLWIDPFIGLLACVVKIQMVFADHLKNSECSKN